MYTGRSSLGKDTFGGVFRSEERSFLARVKPSRHLNSYCRNLRIVDTERNKPTAHEKHSAIVKFEGNDEVVARSSIL